MSEVRPRPAASSAPSNPPRRRCAIYTRKSSEEGLEQAFNSLDAQREACEAYIRSQRGEGWVALSTLYDDGGHSGGTLERPALQQLLADIRAGKVDLVVVYKVDRLTRSLADFAKIVEVFDAHGASFVSVTQSFNTTTSMGRLTLNMLLSFAQFEREVTGERIRDKFAASRRKGLWMGGTVPLGYAVQDRKLVVVEAEAERVRHIYRRYLALGSVLGLAEELAAEGVPSKAGRPLARGALFHLLRNRVYRGEVVHKGQVYPGEQAATVDEELWQAVQERLASNGGERRGRRSIGPGHPALLLRVLYDGTGDRLTPTHALRRGKRYHYYVSHRLVVKGRRAGDGLRVPAADLDRLVTGALLDRLGGGAALRDLLRELGILHKRLAEQQRLMKGAAEFVERWPDLDPGEQRAMLHRLLRRVEVSDQQVAIQLSPADLLEMLLGTAADGASATNTSTPPALLTTPITFSVPTTLKRSGREMALVIGDQPLPAKRNSALVRLLARAQALRDTLLESSADSLDAIAEREGVTKSYLTRLVRLAYISPRIVAAILDGTAPVELKPSRLMRDTRLPLLWAEQQQFLGLT